MFRTETDRMFAHARPGADFSLFARLGRCLTRWRELARQRRALTRLDDATLRDLGVSRAEANFEACRRVWDDPQG